MPLVIAYHDVKDKDHWLSSDTREEFFGPLGVTNIRTFVDPNELDPVGILMDVPISTQSPPPFRRPLAQRPKRKMVWSARPS